MSSQQIQQYIFAAGFSTAEQVTSVSGRGVGMDVVRTNIEKIGGFIDMNSVEGEGTTFTIKIPLTLAIISSLIVGVDTQRYAIPQLDVSELVLIKNSNKNAIEYVNGSPIYRLRDNILPLICLRKLLGYPNQVDGKSRYIIVISSTSLSFGLIVDNVFDTEEIVVKPITSILGDQNIFSGNTILGDGAVIMILDSTGILRTSEISVKVTSVREPLESQDNSNEKITPLLLFNAGSTSLKAVPLEHVARLEDLDVTKIEIANGKHVIQYGNSLMPIYMCDPHARLPERGRKPIIVFRTKEGLSGLLVDRILDITSHRGEYQMKASGDLEGSAIVKGMATDILNLSFDRSSENYKAGFTNTQNSMSPAAISSILVGTSDEIKGEA
jgi:two-component system, chemotaxis family, sensor kinase CheA